MAPKTDVSERLATRHLNLKLQTTFDEFGDRMVVRALAKVLRTLRTAGLLLKIRQDQDTFRCFPFLSRFDMDDSLLAVAFNDALKIVQPLLVEVIGT